MKKYLLILFISAFALSVSAQISITYTNMPNVSDTIRCSNANLSSVGDYTITGANNTWNFSTLIPSGQALRDFKPVSQTPYGIYSVFVSSLNGAIGEKVTDTLKIPNIPGILSQSITITDVYNFYKNQISNFSNSALGLKINAIPVPNSFSDKDELYVFPLNYTDIDTTTFKFSTISNTLIPFQYKKQGYRVTQADGWGSITTPYGTANCLRVVTTQYSQDSVKGSLSVSGIPVPINIGFPNYVRSYQWLTLGEKIPYLEVSGNLIGTNFTPTRAQYRDTPRTFVGIKEETQLLALSIFPNPSTGQLTIITTKNSSAVKAELIDLKGKIVMSSDFINNSDIVNQHQLDVSNLAKGLYILNLSNSAGKQSLKISVQ